MSGNRWVNRLIVRNMPIITECKEFSHSAVGTFHGQIARPIASMCPSMPTRRCHHVAAFFTSVIFAISLLLVGCTAAKTKHQPARHSDIELANYQSFIAEIEYPRNDSPPPMDLLGDAKPFTLQDAQTAEYWDLSLEEAIRIAFQNAEVLKEIGATILTEPRTIGTSFDPAIIETDPRFGVEGALSAFDTQASVFGFGEKLDQPINNNAIVGGGTNVLDQDLAGLNSQLSKRTAHGTLFAIRNNLAYDANNFITNQFPSAWDVNLQALVRQPLLRGAGTEINRIAGPNAVVGLPNGVLVARTRMDVTLAQFEEDVQDYISNVENLYWDLYFAYRNLDARLAARDASLKTWEQTKALLDGGHVGADQEAQARVQYFQFQQQAIDALGGRVLLGTRAGNGSGGGTFNNAGGVLVAERRLRLLLGLPINDTTLLRPRDEPPLAKVAFDWDESKIESMFRRVELRQQEWLIKLNELELIAARNQLLPQLDLVGAYRMRGFGQDLAKKDNDIGKFNNAYDELFGGDYNDWQVGLQLDMPLGFRQGHAAVRNTQLNLSRNRRILKEQQRQVLHDLSNAVAEVERAYENAKTAYNLLLASEAQLESIEAAYEAGQTDLFILLDVQRRLADAEIGYHRASVEYALAIRNVHFEKGSLLDYNQVYLTEGPSGLLPNCKADLSNRYLSTLRNHPNLNYTFTRPRPLSEGVYPQLVEPTGDSLHPLPPIDAMELGPEIPFPATQPEAMPQPAS